MRARDACGIRGRSYTLALTIQLKTNWEKRWIALTYHGRQEGSGKRDNQRDDSCKDLRFANTSDETRG